MRDSKDSKDGRPPAVPPALIQGMVDRLQAQREEKSAEPFPMTIGRLVALSSEGLEEEASKKKAPPLASLQRTKAFTEQMVVAFRGEDYEYVC